MSIPRKALFRFSSSPGLQSDSSASLSNSATKRTFSRLSPRGPPRVIPSRMTSTSPGSGRIPHILISRYIRYTRFLAGKVSILSSADIRTVNVTTSGFCLMPPPPVATDDDDDCDSGAATSLLPPALVLVPAALPTNFLNTSNAASDLPVRVQASRNALNATRSGSSMARYAATAPSKSPVRADALISAVPARSFRPDTRPSRSNLASTVRASRRRGGTHRPIPSTTAETVMGSGRTPSLIMRLRRPRESTTRAL
mmetsp:Transcript_6790/g.20181  ORF Transcript_6790/g.20181 Transcript_6790/m.20181 type:complete len:255 (+) Transcript_6790:463-1227(+)